MNKVILLDGGTGRELQRLGAPFRQPEWSALALMEAPEYVSRVHEAYIAAGADVITTNSYAVVPFHLSESVFASAGGRLAALAGQLARSAARGGSRAVRVAGSLPPVCGSYRADLFSVPVARPVLQTLIGALAPSVDLWLGETLSTVQEAALVAELLAGDRRPLWLSFTLKEQGTSGSPSELRSGEAVREAAEAAVRLGAEAVLFNCSQPEVMLGAIQETSRVLDRTANPHIAIGVYANAFPPQGDAAQANSTLHPLRSELTPQRYTEFARQWVAAGAGIIGGCCGIGPEHIEALRAAWPN